jgi:peptidyl-prolyl cis-trans isomerase C
MKLEKVIVLASVIVVVVAVGVFFRLHSNDSGTPKESALTPPSSDPQSIQPQTPATANAPTDPTWESQPVSEAATQINAARTIEELPASLPQGTVASVNGVLISKAQLEEELNRLLISPGSHGGINADKKEELRTLALEELVTRELAFQEAKKIGMTVNNKEMSASFKRIRGRYKTAEDFSAALKAEDLTEDGLRARIERDLLLTKINRAEIEERAKVTDAIAKQHYEKNKAKFVTPDSVRLWSIVAEVTAGKESEAKQKIDEALKLLRAGKDFFDVAYKHSDDDFRVLGGDHGWVHRGQLPSDMEAIIFSAKVNELTGPFKTASGWNIIKVGGARPEGLLKFEEVKENIKKALYSQRLRQIRIDFINRLKATGTVKYYALANGG